MLRKIGTVVLYTVLAFVAVMLTLIASDFSGWEEATRDSAGVAPLPRDYPGAVVQVYAAELWGWRGQFADHMWVATKRKNANTYTVYEVIGWRLSEGHDTSLRIETDVPDRRWYGAVPRVLVDERDNDVLVQKVQQAAEDYPYPREYSAFGPNSNTFIAWVLCSVPELGLTLTNRAIGKDYLNGECEV